MGKVDAEGLRAPMTDTPDIAAIARGLTEAQRKAIAGAGRRFGILSLHGAPATLHSLKRKGITCGPFATSLTDPLGLAVREHLTGSTVQGEE